jgi:hypothetical protein
MLDMSRAAQCCRRWRDVFLHYPSLILPPIQKVLLHLGRTLVPIELPYVKCNGKVVSLPSIQAIPCTLFGFCAHNVFLPVAFRFRWQYTQEQREQHQQPRVRANVLAYDLIHDGASPIPSLDKLVAFDKLNPKHCEHARVATNEGEWTPFIPTEHAHFRTALMLWQFDEPGIAIRDFQVRF